MISSFSTAETSLQDNNKKFKKPEKTCTDKLTVATKTESTIMW